MQVAYCAEQFENDGSPTSTIVKSVKRAMAGEYSRELSVKVFAGQCRLIELGYRQGGPAGFGLRRALLNERGEVKAELKRGEHKSLQTDRVILVPGPEEEQRVVRRIYEMFVNEGRPEREKEADRQKLLIKKAELTQGQLLFICQAFRTLLEDDHFVTLLRAEGLETMPSYLQDSLAEGAAP